MKTLILCFSFIRKNIVPVIIVMILILVSLFVLVTLIGEYRYMSYTRDVLLRSEYKDGAYFMVPLDPSYVGYEKYDAFRDEIRKFDACGDIITIKKFSSQITVNGVEMPLNVIICGEKLRKMFQLDVKEGSWFKDGISSVSAVVGGVTVRDISVGDVISVSGIEAEVVGKIGDVVFYPSFNSSGNTGTSADELFDKNDTMVFLSEEGIPEREYEEKRGFRIDANSYVVIKKDADENSRKELLTFLENNGWVAQYGDIIAESDRRLEMHLRSLLPLPVFLIVVSTVCAICICGVIVKRSLPDFSKYYMIGCTRKRCIMLISAPLAVLFGLPCAANIASVFFFPHYLRARSVGAINYIIDARSAIPVLVYFAALTAILYAIPAALYGKNSPLDFYRRNV